MLSVMRPSWNGSLILSMHRILGLNPCNATGVGGDCQYCLVHSILVCVTGTGSTVCIYVLASIMSILNFYPHCLCPSHVD